MDTQTILALIARHTLTTVAGVLIAHGYLNSSATEQFISAAMLLLGVGWSWWQKTGQAEVLAERAKLKAQRTQTTAAAVQASLQAKYPPTGNG